MTKKTTIAGLVIARNEEQWIGHCLDTLAWCDQLLVIDDGSTDKTVEVAESKGASVISFKHSSFSRLREEALRRVETDWVIYLDADERLTPTSAREVQVKIETREAEVFRFRRRNIHFGRELKHGGWENDWVERVFLRSHLKGWQGDVHETPVFKGKVADLALPLLHLTHRDVISGLKKTIAWTPIEAEALATELDSPVTFWTFIRKSGLEFFKRAFWRGGVRDGMPGLVEALIQAVNRLLVYIQVWEKQQKPPIASAYERWEEELAEDWAKERAGERRLVKQNKAAKKLS